MMDGNVSLNAASVRMLYYRNFKLCNLISADAVGLGNRARKW